MDAIVSAINTLDAMVWGPPMILLLLGTHIYMTVRTGFIQRKLPTAIKLSITKDPDAEGDISQFGALTTALSATIGTGNIVGVATAIMAGGPGAVFWMWLTGVFGIATKYSEVYAAVKYRVKDKRGDMLGGAMYAWERAFRRKDGFLPWWAKLGAVSFALFAIVATIGTGSAVQSAAMTGIIESNFPGIPEWLIALVIAILVSVVIFGGVKTVSVVCEKLVPFMTVAYAVGCLAIMAINWQYLGPAFALIFECAFTSKAAFGGAVGSGIMVALQFGCARGLFSNESGLGSAPIVDACAATRNPSRQALISMSGVFWDTIVVCLLTGLVLVSSIIKDPVGMEGLKGAQMTAGAFNAIPVIGPAVLTFGLITFAWSTILGWAYYGERAWVYLVGVEAIKPFRVAWTIVVLVGCSAALDVVWNVADTLNACMAFPNLIALLGLSGVIASETKKYVWDKDAEMGGLMKWMDDVAPSVDK